MHKIFASIFRDAKEFICKKKYLRIYMNICLLVCMFFKYFVKYSYLTTCGICFNTVDISMGYFLSLPLYLFPFLLPLNIYTSLTLFIATNIVDFLQQKIVSISFSIFEFIFYFFSFLALSIF